MATLRRQPYDLILLFLVLSLIGIGVVMVFSASISTAAGAEQDAPYWLKRQLIHSGLAIVALLVGMRLSTTLYRKLVYFMFGGILLVLLILFIPGVGENKGNATRWLDLGFVSFQPSEFAKIIFIFYLSHSLSKKNELIRSFKYGVLPHLIISGSLIALCVLQPDLGTGIILGLIMVVLLYVAGTRVSFIFLTIAVAIPLVYLLIVTSPERMRRMAVFLNPWPYRYSDGFQFINSLLGFGSGGLFGKGLGMGPQTVGGFIIKAQTDFIFSVIGEELGFVGVTAVIFIYLGIVIRGTIISIRARSEFSRLVGFGITALLGLHSMINIGVVIGLFPTKGLTLPFISAGGSSLIAYSFALGVLLHISRESRVPASLVNERRDALPPMEEEHA